MTGPQALELGSDWGLVSITKVSGSPRGTMVEDHTGMCSSLYSSWPSSSKFGSASSESSCKREQKGGRGREADSPPPAPQLLLGPAALTAPRPLQASLTTETVAPG